MNVFEPKTAEQREACVKAGMESKVYNVCWKCGEGPHNKRTLYRVGKSLERTVYGCSNHRGLVGQMG